MLDGLHPYFRVFHSGINVGLECFWMILMAIVLKLSHAMLFTHLANQAKTVTLPDRKETKAASEAA